jgi:hypothetical protein
VTTATADAHLSIRRDRCAATRAVSRSAGRRHRPGVAPVDGPGRPGTARPPLPLNCGCAHARSHLDAVEVQIECTPRPGASRRRIPQLSTSTLRHPQLRPHPRRLRLQERRWSRGRNGGPSRACASAPRARPGTDGPGRCARRRGASHVRGAAGRACRRGAAAPGHHSGAAATRTAARPVGRSPGWADRSSGWADQSPGWADQSPGWADRARRAGHRAVTAGRGGDPRTRGPVRVAAPAASRHRGAVRSPAAPVRARPPGRRPRRRRRPARVRGARRHRGVRRAGGRPWRGVGAPRRRPAHDVRAGAAHRAGGRRRPLRRRDRTAGAGPPRLRRGGLPALGCAPRASGVPGSAGAAAAARGPAPTGARPVARRCHRDGARAAERDGGPALSRPRTPPACRAVARPTGCAAGTPATR